MIRRTLLVAAAAFALILAPTVAMAYNAPGYTSSVSDPTPAVDQPITVTLQGGAANANQLITLKITGAGTKSLTATANASGVASFTFVLGASGAYTLTMTNEAGAVVSTQTLTVLGVSAAAAVPGAVSGGLATTGFDGMPLAVGGGVLVLAGAGAVIIARRRKSAHVPA